LIANVDKCTNVVCDAKKGVIKTPVVCSTTDKCKKSYCDAKLGCMTTPVTCESTSHCGITYSCNSNSGFCEPKIPTCTNEGEASCFRSRYVAGLGCVREEKCKAPNNCTITSCVNGKCTFRARVCDDGNACTEDSCNPEGKCVNTPKVCRCSSGFVAVCNPSNGKCETSVKCRRDFECDDKNPATRDVCDKQRGCIHIVPPPITLCDDLDATKIFFTTFDKKYDD